MAVGRGRGGRKEGKSDGAREEGVGAREGENSGGVEVGPGANLADIPPKVLGVGVAVMIGDGADQRRRRVGSSQVGHEGGSGSRLSGEGKGRNLARSILLDRGRGIHVGRLGGRGLRHVGGHLAVGGETKPLNDTVLDTAGGRAAGLVLLLLLLLLLGNERGRRA